MVRKYIIKDDLIETENKDNIASLLEKDNLNLEDGETLKLYTPVKKTGVVKLDLGGDNK